MTARRLAAALLIGLLTALAAPAATGQALSTKPATAAATYVVHLRPVTAKGQLKRAYYVEHTFSFARCIAGSEATGNAYRCFAGKSNHDLNRVLDPCWVEGNKRFVVCLPQPWGFNVTELTVTKGYDNAGRTTKHAKLPWGVQLRNGVQCGYLQGAGATVGGKRVNYDCARSKLVLYGGFQVRNHVWRIHSARQRSGGFTKVGHPAMTAVWFGQPSRKG